MAQKGYTIKIGADMSDFNKKMSDAEKTSRNYQKELREVNKLLKLDPTNTTLLAQKQELLSKNISVTKTKLDELKSSEQKMQNALKNNDAYQKSYVPLKKEIEDTDDKLKKLINNQEKMDKQLSEGKISQQKYDAFQKELDETKEKSISLTKELKNLDKSFEDGHIDEAQYREFQREIEKTEQQLKGLEEQAKETNKALSNSSSGLSEKFTNTGEKLENVGNKMLPISAGVAALGTLAVKSMDAVDNGLDIIVKKTGATGDRLNEFKGILDDLAGEVPLGFENIGSAIGEVNTRLGFTGDTLKQSSKDFLEFAHINDIDVSESVRLVARAMGDANIPMDQYNSLLDMLTVASHKSGISISNLTENIAKYGAPMRALGFDTKESIALFSQWEATGTNVETAFSGMKKSISNWSSAGKDARKEFGKSLEQIKSAPDIASATTKAIEVFGAKAGPDLADAIRGGRFEIDEYVKALENSEGAVDSTYAGIVDGVDNTQTALQNFQTGLHDLGEVIMIMLGNILLPLSQAFKSFMNIFNTLPSPLQQVIVAIGGALLIGGPLLIFIGKISQGIGAIINIAPMVSSALSGIGGVVKGLFTMIMQHPVIAIITAIVGAIIYLYTNCEWFRDMINNILTFLSQLLQVFFDSIGSWFTNMIAGAQNVATNVSTFFQNCFINITNFFSGIPAFFKGIFSDAYNGIVNFFSPITKFFSNIYSNICKIFTNIGSKIGGAVSLAFKSAVNSVMKIVDNIVNGFIDNINWAIGIINKIPGVSIGKIGRVKIPYMATGGILEEGQSIVAEAGPELVQLINGKAKVTPLSSQSKVTSLQNGNINSDFNSQIQSSQSIEITLQYKDLTLGKAVIKDLKELQRMNGKTYLLEG